MEYNNLEDMLYTGVYWGPEDLSALPCPILLCSGLFERPFANNDKPDLSTLTYKEINEPSELF